MLHRWLQALGLIALLAQSAAWADESDTLAKAFGKLPALWGVRMSPDGSKLSFLQMHAQDLPIAVTLDMRTGEMQLALASVENEFDIQWCEWANDERLLCGFYGVVHDAHELYGMTRLVAVNADGSDMRVLLQRKLEDQWTQFQDRIIDWLVDDPKQVLVAMPTPRGSGVSRVDIYKGSVATEIQDRDGIYDWLSDNRGTPRLRFYLSRDDTKWQYRRPGELNWRLLHKSEKQAQDVDYQPLGFGRDPNRLLVLKRHEGRMALYAEDLGETRETELLFAHPEVDVDEPLFLGKYNRMVAIAYSTDKRHLHYVDEEVEKISDAVAAAYPGRFVDVVDESWDHRYYVIYISSDRDPGAYYWLDLETKKLALVAKRRPELEGRELAPMKPIRYPARDGTQIPAYLIVPPSATPGGGPAVILPHGGPTARDYWGFDWIAQFLAAKGYAVLQSNYRGSGGYGGEWSGEGAFRAWRLAIDDITDGAKYLVESGIADAGRLGIVGWSYGGYAALQSVVVEPERYRCAVSIAPVSDPGMWAEQFRKTYSIRAVREFVGSDKEVLQEGSPLRRAREIRVPVLLFHGDEDINVSAKHSRKMNKVLKRAKTPVSYVEYDEADHQIWRDAYRVDMLTRIGAFLEQCIGTHAKAEAAQSSVPGGSGARAGE